MARTNTARTNVASVPVAETVNPVASAVDRPFTSVVTNLDPYTVEPTTTVNPVVNVDDKDWLKSVPEKATVKTATAYSGGTLKTVDRRKIIVHRENNPRNKSRYTLASLEPLAREIYAAGCLRESLMLSQRADGTLHALKGHRRLAAIEALCNEGFPATKNLPMIPALGSTYMTEVPAIVKTGLSVAEELILIHDHADPTKLGLSRAELYYAGKMLAETCLFTHDQIASQLGMSRSNYTNSIAHVVEMPTCVEDAYTVEDSTLTQPTIGKLWKAYSEDVKARDCQFGEAGPQFKAAWEDYIRAGSAPQSRMLTKANIEELGKVARESDIVSLLTAIIDGRKGDAADIIARIRFRLKPDASYTEVSEGIKTVVGNVD